MLRPIPFPVMIEGLIVGAAAGLLGLVLIIRGTLPRWFPSGFVDQTGNRADLSKAVYRLIGVTCVLVAGGLLVIVLSKEFATVGLGFSLLAIGLICVSPAILLSLRERRERSLRQKRSTAVWSTLAFILVMALNYGLLYTTHK